MKKGYLLRQHGLVRLCNCQNIQLFWTDEDAMARCWPGIKQLTPIGERIPVEYQGVKNSFTIKIVKN